MAIGAPAAGTSSICPKCQAANPPGERYCLLCRAELAEPNSSGRSAPLPPGTLLNQRYEIVRVIDSGGMGIVYEACAQNLGNLRCAIKALSEVDGQMDADEHDLAVRNFEREATMLAHLSHPNLPRVFDHFTEDNRHYLVMDYVEGESLQSVLEKNRRKPLPLPQTLRWMIELCNVLSYLHNQSPPIIFRDLKPGNVMLVPVSSAEEERPRFRVMLIDFGIARFFDPAKGKDTQAYGTPGYSAPEQYGKQQTDARSDIYSLGVILHELLTGYDPANTPFRLPCAIRLNPHLPAGIDGIVQKATRSQPGQRYQTVLDFKRALVSLQQDLQISTSQPATTASGPPHQSSPAAVQSMAGSGGVSPLNSPKKHQPARSPSCWVIFALVTLFMLLMCIGCVGLIWWISNIVQENAVFNFMPFKALPGAVIRCTGIVVV